MGCVLVLAEVSRFYFLTNLLWFCFRGYSFSDSATGVRYTVKLFPSASERSFYIGYLTGANKDVRFILGGSLGGFVDFRLQVFLLIYVFIILLK